MDAELFAQMLADEKLFDLKRMQYKYSVESVAEFVQLLKKGFYRELPLRDFAGSPIVYQPNALRQNGQSLRVLLTPERGTFGIQAMEDEFQATLNIEQISSSRHSVRRMLKGFAPENDEEVRLYGMKQGLDFIASSDNAINEASLRKLYDMAIGGFLSEENKLLPGKLYRHAPVYISDGRKDIHAGLKPELLPEYMLEFVTFIQQDDDLDELTKAALIHGYLAYLHPYFDGNGRIARLLHQWYLVQRGYASTLFVSFSKLIEASKRQYYRAFRLIEENAAISGVLDMTPLLSYFAEHVYAKLERPNEVEHTAIFERELAEGKLTAKEKALWEFVCSTYGKAEFSTKELEKEYGNAAYATIRTFVLKFSELGLLTSQSYGNRKKYHIS